MNSKPLGIGVIGAGAILKRHALAYRGLPHLAKLVGIADLEEKRARAAKEAFKFEEAVTDYNKLLSREDIDVIDVAAPAGAHKRMVLDALSAGKHVICEKPLATTLADADAIVEAAERYGASGSGDSERQGARRKTDPPVSPLGKGGGSERGSEGPLPYGHGSGATPPGPPP